MVWLVKVFSPGLIQLMCCALKSTSEGKGERRRPHRCEKEYNVAAMKVNCVVNNSVEKKSFLNGMKQGLTYLNLSNRNSRLQLLDWWLHP